MPASNSPHFSQRKWYPGRTGRLAPWAWPKSPAARAASSYATPGSSRTSTSRTRRAPGRTLRHIEQSLAVASRTGLDVEGQFEIVALADDYVFGYVMRAREGFGFAGDDSGAQRRLDAMLAYVDVQLATGEFPNLAALAGDDPRGGFMRVAQLTTDEPRFERGLQILLDGIELDLERRRGRAT